MVTLPHRLSYEELCKEVEHWREEISECKKMMEEAEETPHDLAEQMNVFIPVRQKYTSVIHCILSFLPSISI